MTRRRLHVVCAVLAIALVGEVAAAQPVRIGIPERDNLQYLSFWIAQGAGLFAAEGLDVEIVYADVPNQSGMILMQGRVDVALMQPPVYLGLIAEQHPFVLFANLLANEPINLIVRADVAAKLELDPRAPLADRLKAIKGLRIGVAPEPPRRLRVLFAHAGLNADQDVQIVIRRAEDQIEALTSGVVDALYIHTPFLQDAIVRLGAVVLVNQSSGEVAPLANGQIHSLGATRAYVAAHPDVILKVTRAIARAQQLLHRDAGAAIAALLKAGITSPTPQHLETIVKLYEPAVPQSPAVSAAAVERNATLYPARPTMPDFTRVRAADFVATSFAEEAIRSEAHRFDLGVVEVTGASAPTALSPLSSSIDAAAIRNYHALTVRDAIEYLPGVSIDHKSPRNQTGIAIGGFDSRQVPLYIDGIPAYVPHDGYVDLGRYLTSGAAELQVAKGDASPLLGPNILGGVVNLVTRQPQRDLEGEALVGAGAGHQVNAGLQVGGRWRSMFATGSIDRLQSDFFRLADDFTPTAIQPIGKRTNSSQRDDRYRMRIAWATRSSDLYVVSASSQRGSNDAPPYAGSAPPCPAGNAVATVPCVTPRFWRWPQWDTDSFYFNSQTRLGASSALQLRAFYSAFVNRQEMFDDATYSTMNVNASSGVFANDDHSFGVSGRADTHVWSRHEIGASFFVKHDTHTEQTTTVARTNVATVTPRQADRDRQSSFGLQDVIALTSRITATVGFSADQHVPLEAQDLGADRLSMVPFAIGESVWTFNPVGAMTVAAGRAGTLFVTASKRSRFPTMKDRYSYRAGRALPNPLLRPERARTWSAGYSRSIATRTMARFEAYRSNVTDEIENIFFLSPLCSGGGRGGAGSCQQAVNVGSEVHAGASLSVRSTAIPRVTVDANYSYLHRDVDGANGAIATGTPRHKSVASATMALVKRASAIASIRHQSGILAIGDNGLPLPSASFTTIDAGATIPFRRLVNVQAGVQNLFDANYYYWEGFPEAGRNLYVTLRVTF